jgi:anti-sigma B factor antagonist
VISRTEAGTTHLAPTEHLARRSTQHRAIRYCAMAESKLTIEERRTGDVIILVLTGQMLLDDGDLAFGKRIRDLVERGFAKVVLDLGAVSYIDSSGVGMLVAKLKTLKEKGGDMRLLHLNRRAESLLGMLKLLVVFETFQDEAAAVRSFAQRT